MDYEITYDTEIIIPIENNKSKVIESDEEYWELYDMTFDEKCEYFNVVEEYDVMPGGKFHRYEFHISSEHAVMIETVAWNV